ncbi:protease inhibitor I42 family protein [Streptomyces albus]|uniref:Uncharacterized protein n=1 Tax=Streptomyces albus TaxID=1888 RepID=A0A6C1C8U4_9ACTN|nr:MULTISPECIES: protease inhibitor I42 family protein [Streptomyces]QID39323.1 protease inhibitor I42 family protein [Streptomyces albus]TGG86058.1 hypothetical protein D8771_06480 [Streptomyces albus]UVN53627.1 protease inhibitor I42 family protein [Streptomyces albus]
MTHTLRAPRRAAVSVVALLCLLTTACGGADDGEAAGSAPSPEAASSAPSPSASGSARPSQPAPAKVFGKDHTEIEVAPGETFALKLRISPSAGYDWEPARPAPDPAVVVRTGERSKADDPDRMGSPGYHFFDYRAEAEGSTRVRLRKDCFACGGEEEKAAKAGRKGPEVVFRITVKE